MMKGMACLGRAFAVAGAIACGTVEAATAQPIDIRTVALSGAPAEGLPPGITFGSVGGGVINQSGETAFLGELQGPGVERFETGVVVKETNGSIQIVAQEGRPVPPPLVGPALQATYASVSNVLLSDTGQVSYTSLLDGPTVPRNTQGVFTQQRSGVTNLMLYEGGPVPGFDNARVVALSSLHLNQAGLTQAGAMVNLPGETTVNPLTIFRDEGLGAEPSVVLREAVPLLDPLNQTLLTQFPFAANSPTLNDRGHIALRANAVTPFPDFSVTQTIYQGDPAALSRVIGVGDPAPGFDDGSTIDFLLSNITINNAGQIAFYASVDQGKDEALYVQRPDGRLDPVVRSNHPVPGSDTFEIQINNAIDFALNGAGQVAFNAPVTPDVSGFPRTGLFLETDGVLQTVALPGQDAPGANPGTKFLTIHDFAINARGQVAFLAAVRGDLDNPDGPRGAGLWATDFDGTLRLIAGGGSAFSEPTDPVGRFPDGFFSIALGGGAGGGEDGSGRVFNDRGEVLFRLQFDSSNLHSGLFVATIPEPSAAAVVLVGTGGGLLLGRRRKAPLHKDHQLA